MITIRQNTTWGLLGASRILLLCIIYASYAVADEPRPATRSAGLMTNAGLGGDRLTDLRFAHITTDDGLSQSTVTEILQDRRGFMWFATRDGLNRYDGNAFVVYKHNPSDPQSLSANFVLDLMEDDQGYLWIATNFGGLDKFDPATERFIHYRHDPNNPNTISSDAVESIARDSRGYLWIGTNSNGLDRFDPSTVTFTHYRNDSDGQFVGRVTKVIAGTAGDIWFVGERGLFHLNTETGQITRPPATIATSLAADHVYEDAAGNLWMLTWSPVVGLVKYDRYAERLTTYPVGAGAVGVASSNILAEGQNGFWVSSSLGLYYFDRRTERFTRRFQHDDTNLNSLDDNTVAAVYRDRGGLLWVGTGSGLNLLDLRQQQFGHHRHVPNAANSLSPGRVTAIHKESNDVLWVGFSPRALDRLNQKTGEVTHYVPDPENGNALTTGMNVSGIFKDARGYLWLGGWGAGLDRFDERTRQFKHYRYNPDNPNSLLSDGIYSIYGDRSGHIWVGQLYGVSRLNPATNQFTNFLFDPKHPTWNGSSVSAIYQDRSGTLWLGTTGGALIRVDDKTETLVKYPPDPRDPHKLNGGPLMAILEDRAGILWVGAWDGLYRANHQTATFTRYTETQGLPSSVILGILEDKAGKLWLSTKKGISRFDPQMEVFRNYDVSDGLQGDEFSQGCYFQGPDGEMFFCGSNGFNAFFPEAIRDNPYVPPVEITGVKIFNKPVPIGPKSVLKKAIQYVDSLTLPYSDKVFSFEFAALSYVNSHKNLYRYKLEGFEASWNEVGSNQRFATYTNLDPAKYIFRVQGSNSDGVWNQEGVALHLQILPPWWATWWFRSACAAVFLALFWTGYQFRVRQLQRESRRLRDMIETIPAMTWTVSPDGSNAFVNSRWAEYSGLSVEDTAGLGWMAAVHPEDRQPSSETWRAALAAGEPFECEARFRCAANGEYRWFLARGVPLRDEHGDVRRWYGALTDIEDRKRAEGERAKVLQLEADLAHINRVSMMGELAASIAHEVNQPLSGIVSNGSACLRWLAGDAPNVEEVREAVGDIVRDGTRAGEVIARIRALTKRTAPPEEELDVNDTVREVLALVGDEAKRNSVQIRLHFASYLTPVSGDRVQLQQVVLNLIMNAIEAMSSEEDRPRELLISTRNIDADQVQVSVADSGPGLDPNTASRIFEPFYTTKPAGMGMGLSISRSIVQNHGGRLWATVNEGPGASFHFTLPKYHEEESHAAVAGV